MISNNLDDLQDVIDLAISRVGHKKVLDIAASAGCDVRVKTAGWIVNRSTGRGLRDLDTRLSVLSH